MAARNGLQETAVGCRAGERLSLLDGRPAVAMIEGPRLLVQRWCCDAGGGSHGGGVIIVALLKLWREEKIRIEAREFQMNDQRSDKA